MLYIFTLINFLIFIRQAVTCRRGDAIFSLIGFVLSGAIILLAALVLQLPLWNEFTQKIIDFKLYFALFCFLFGFVCIIGKMASLNKINDHPMRGIKTLNFLLGVFLGFNITFLFALNDSKTLLTDNLNSIPDGLIFHNIIVLLICAFIALVIILGLTTKAAYRALRPYREVIDPVFGVLFAGLGIWIVLAVAPLRLYGLS